MPDLVVKVGGGLLATAGDLDRVLSALSVLARSCPLLVVPGGGPFADTVRRVDRDVGIPDDTAHWMAVLGMDQYGHLLAARLDGAEIVTGLLQARCALAAHRIPVLAPYRWLQDDDPLPHTWDVTSDSIAAWVATASGAREIALVKPRGASGDVLDKYFPRAVSSHVRVTIATAEQVDVVFRQIAARVEPNFEMT